MGPNCSARTSLGLRATTFGVSVALRRLTETGGSESDPLSECNNIFNASSTAEPSPLLTSSSASKDWTAPRTPNGHAGGSLHNQPILLESKLEPTTPICSYVCMHVCLVCFFFFVFCFSCWSPLASRNSKIELPATQGMYKCPCKHGHQAPDYSSY